MGTHKDRALAMGRSIRTLRKRRNLTQKELAQLSGLSESSLRSYELGARYPKADGIARIAKALAVPLNVSTRVILRLNLSCFTRCSGQKTNLALL